MPASNYDDLIAKAAENFRLDSNLIRAIIKIESSFNTWANRFEPGCTYAVNISDYANKLLISYETEENNQHCSWGLMQVMGFLARELEFTDNITMLCQPEIGIFYGCKQLRRLSDRKDCPYETDIISSYNQGSPLKTIGGLYRNQSYLDKVCGELQILRKLN